MNEILHAGIDCEATLEISDQAEAAILRCEQCSVLAYFKSESELSAVRRENLIKKAKNYLEKSQNCLGQNPLVK